METRIHSHLDGKFTNKTSYPTFIKHYNLSPYIPNPLTSFLFSAEVALVVFSLLPLLAAALLLLVFATVSAASAALLSFEVEACSEVSLESAVFSGADLNEALVGVLATVAAAVSFLLATLLGVLLPAVGLLSGFAGADLLGDDLVGVLLSLSFVVLEAEVGLEGVILLAEAGLVGVVCVLVCGI